MAKETIRTPMSQGSGHNSPQPSGKVCTDAESTVKGLPSRSQSSVSVDEVIYDENMGIPSRSGGK